MRPAFLLQAAIAFGLLASTSLAAEPTTEELEFFEKQVRPLLVSRCYKCHGPKSEELAGGLAVFSKQALLSGGDSGPALVPGDAKKSLLIDAVNYGELFQMPPKTKLPAEEIATLTRWVEMGAPWPKEAAPEPEIARSDFDLQARQREHWSWQPIQITEPPAVQQTDWPRTPLDAYILSKLEEAGLKPAADADRRTLIRRAYFALMGLPPSPEEVEAFVADDSPQAFENLVDRLLASPNFGERWGRHWLDLVRYAESRGHEFDYNASNAWQYRDYVIRAFNADVPYDRFVQEHLAGDLLPEPRLNPDKGFNESILGTGFWFLGEWVHSPVDIRNDQVERFDNMVDVASKAFLGLTVGCARCHDHKFDAIGTRDYYALFGFLQSSSHRLVRFESLEHNRQVAGELNALRSEYRQPLARALVAAVRPTLDSLPEYLLAAREATLTLPPAAAPREDILIEDFEGGTYLDWQVEGDAFGDSPVTQQTIAPYQGNVGAQGKFFVNTHYVRNGGKGDAHQGTLTSAEFTITRSYLRMLIGGGAHQDKTCVNLLIDGKPVRTATGRNDNRMQPHWWNLSDLQGKRARIQVVDRFTGGWGNIGLDHLVLTDRGPQGLLPVRFTEAQQQHVNGIASRLGLDSEVLTGLMLHLPQAAKDPADPLHAFAKVYREGDSPIAPQLKPLTDAWRASSEAAAQALVESEIVVDYANLTPGQWIQDGFSFRTEPVRPGDFDLSGDLARPIGQVFTQAAAQRDPAFNGLRLAPGAEKEAGRMGSLVRAGQTLVTPSFTVTHGKVYCLVRGQGHLTSIVNNHRMINGPLHGRMFKDFKHEGETRWLEHDLSTYRGHTVHLELTAEAAAPMSVLMVVQAANQPGDPIGPNELLQEALAEPNLAGQATLAKSLQQALRTAAEQFAGEDCTPAAAELADWLAQNTNWLVRSDQRQALAEAAAPYLQRYAALGNTYKKESALAMAMLDGTPVDEHLLIRGNSKNPGEVVPRRFLKALGGEPIEATGSGRLQLARQMTDPRQNPFISRVLVNRVWHHLFSRGIVASTDNFGVLGAEPTHPLLLDYLADQFVQEGWSTKRLIRSILLSRTWQMSSQPNPAAEEIDPDNKLLHRMNLHRLEAEAVRDAVLAVSGRLQADQQFGPSVPVYLTPFMTGRGRPAGGPLDGQGRRSIYLSIRRNFLSPTLLAFDFPIPFTTRGRRTVSNVPAQALILMNDPLVVDQTRVWAEHILSQGEMDTPQRIRQMYLAAFARPPSESEQTAAEAFLREQAALYGLNQDQGLRDVRPWADLGHVLFNVKEFIFIR